MLHWICSNTMTDHMPNVTFRRLLGVESISRKIREGCLCWYGHVRLKCTSSPVKRVEHISVRGKRKRGRPCRMWADQLSLDMGALNLTGDLTLNKNDWRRLIRVVETRSLTYRGFECYGVMLYGKGSAQSLTDAFPIKIIVMHH